MAADLNFDQFEVGGGTQVGDQLVGLRNSDLTKNFKFDFPGIGVRDVNGNVMLQWATTGILASNWPKVINSLPGNSVQYTAEGNDSDIGIEIKPKGNAGLKLDDINWPLTPGPIGSFLFMMNSTDLGFTVTPVVTDIIGTANQVLANGTSGVAQGGMVTLTTPQDIAPTSSLTFNELNLTIPLPVSSGGIGLNILTPNSMFYAFDANTFSEITPEISAMIVTDPSGVPQMTPTLTNGQIVIGGTGSLPKPGIIAQGTGIIVTLGNNTIKIDSTGGGVSWTEVTGISQVMLQDNGFITNNAGLVTLTLPVTATLGTILRITGKGAGGWKIAQNAGQSIRFGSSTTTVGAAGSLASTNSGDTLDLVCTTANTVFTVQCAPQGIITVV